MYCTVSNHNLNCRTCDFQFVKSNTSDFLAATVKACRPPCPRLLCTCDFSITDQFPTDFCQNLYPDELEVFESKGRSQN